MGMSARATVVLLLANGNPKEVELGQPTTADCYVIPSRGGNDKSVVLFKRSFAAHLIEMLSKKDPAKLNPKATEGIENLKKDDALSKLSKMHKDGVTFEEFIDPSLGIFLTDKKTPKNADKPWCFIRVTMVDLER
jgi:hypothetical protein